jgi:hypothetical protein
VKADFCATKKAGKKTNPAKTVVCQFEQEIGQVGEDS